MIYNLDMILLGLFTQPPELTTAITNIAIVIASLVCLVLTLRSKHDKMRVKLWSGVYIALSVAAFSGVLIHGLNISRQAYERAWILQSCLLCAAISAFFIATVYELTGERHLKSRTVPFTAAACIAACAAMLIFKNFWSDYLLIFTGYAGVLFGISLIIYLYLAIKQKNPRCLLAAGGIIIQMLGGLVQAQGTFLVNIFGLDYDFNSFCHVFIVFSLFFFQSYFMLGEKASSAGRKS